MSVPKKETKMDISIQFTANLIDLYLPWIIFSDDTDFSCLIGFRLFFVLVGSETISTGTNIILKY